MALAGQDMVNGLLVNAQCINHVNVPINHPVTLFYLKRLMVRVQVPAAAATAAAAARLPMAAAAAAAARSSMMLQANAVWSLRGQMPATAAVAAATAAVAGICPRNDHTAFACNIIDERAAAAAAAAIGKRAAAAAVAAAAGTCTRTINRFR